MNNNSNGSVDYDLASPILDYSIKKESLLPKLLFCIIRHRCLTNKWLSENLDKVLPSAVKQEHALIESTAIKRSSSASYKRASIASLEQPIFSERSMRIKKEILYKGL